MITSVAIIAISAIGFTQGTPVRREESPPPLPVGDWRTVDVGGGFTFEYFFAWKPYELVSPDHEVFPWDICSYPCRVKLHENHAQCDFSCDEPCETEHKQMIEPIWVSNMGNLYSWLGRTFQSLNNTKIPWSFKSRGEGSVDAVATDFQSHIIDPVTTGEYRNEAIQVYDGGHQKEPCGRTRFRYRLGRSTLVMKYRLSDASGKLGDGEYIPAGYVYAPLFRIPREELPYTTGGCVCTEEGHSSNLFVPSDTGLQPPGVWIDEGNTGKYVLATPAIMDRHGVQLVCPDMTQYEITATHPTMPISVLVTPGAVLKPLDSTYQDVLLASRVLAKFAPGQGLFADTRSGFMAPPSSGQAACLHMNKQMPTRATKFRATIPADGRLAHLGRVGSEQVTYGPWDQARVWIYTEGASLEKVNEKMLIGVTTTQYVTELFNLERKVGVDLASSKYRNCLAPSHLLGKAGPAAPIEWFATKMAEVDPAGVATFLNDHRADFSELFSGFEVARQRLHVVALVNGLLSSRDSRVQLSTLRLLNAHADSAELNILRSNRGLGWAGRLLKSKDMAIAQEALNVFERLGHPYALSFLPTANSAHPDLRQRVASLTQRLELVAKQ